MSQKDSNQSEEPEANVPMAVVVASGSVLPPLKIPNISADSISDILSLALDGDIFKIEARLDRRQWAKAPERTLVWESFSFPPDVVTRKDIPKVPGVYVFVAEPSLFSLSQTSTLLYVGKAKSLYSRISPYISDLSRRRHETDRPHVWRMLNVWNGHLRYYYAITNTVGEAEELEDEMIAALIPYFNKELPAELSPRLRAFP